MKKFLFFLLAILVLVPSCKPKLEEEVVSSWPDGSPQKVNFYEVKGEERIKVKEIRYHLNGAMEMEGGYVNGKKEGHWLAWFDNGQKQSEGYYENDLRNGKSVVWKRDGMKYYEGYYSKGKLHGTWVFYDTDGSRSKEVLFEHDEKIREMDFKNPQQE